MKIRLILSSGILLMLTMVSQSQRTALDDYVGSFRIFRNMFRDVAGKTTTPGSRLFEDARKNGQLQEPISSDTRFPCDLTNARSSSPPISVHKLSPGDIDVVAAMGDSLTAGVGATATTLPHILVENRGVAWSGGGQGTWREFLTLPNILKIFNPRLIGYALGDSYTTEKESQFNVAESLAISSNMPYMAMTLVKRMKNDPRVDIDKHWKLITLMIGCNDFCEEICYETEPRSILKKHQENLITTMRIIRDNLPRTFVSLVHVPQLKTLVEFNGRDSTCELTVDVECFCLFGMRWRHMRDVYYDIISEWQNVEATVAQMPEFHREDFTIVVQPFTKNITLPVLPNGSSDRTALSVDCFHLTQKSYARAANALWNNLMEPVGHKSINWRDIGVNFTCPTEQRPYIATMRNS